MAQNRWTIRNYNAALSAIKQAQGVTHKQAQAAYKNLATKLGHPVRGVDVKRNPKETTTAVNKVKRAEKKQAVERAKEKKKPVEAIEDIKIIEEWESTAEYTTGVRR